MGVAGPEKLPDASVLRTEPAGVPVEATQPLELFDGFLPIVGVRPQPDSGGGASDHLFSGNPRYAAERLVDVEVAAFRDGGEGHPQGAAVIEAPKPLPAFTERLLGFSPTANAGPPDDNGDRRRAKDQGGHPDDVSIDGEKPLGAVDQDGPGGRRDSEMPNRARTPWS